MNIKVLRHLEESSSTTIERDGDINPQEIILLVDHYVPSILTNLASGDYDDVVIISSDKLRSIQTANLLRTHLKQHITLPITLLSDNRTSAEIHGTYKPAIPAKHPAIKKAKFAYLTESRDRGNVWYRHGSPESAPGRVEYPELDEIFDSPGENQVELNIRLYHFIFDLLQWVKAAPRTLFVLPTHHIVLSTLLCLEYIAKKKGRLGALFYFPFGEMYKEENRATEEMVGGWDNFYQFYHGRHYIFDVDVALLEEILPSLQSELDLYVAMQTQKSHTTPGWPL